MDLTQTKLSKEEWESLEVPVKPEELTILKMIANGYHNVNIKFNNTLSLLNFIKIDSTEEYHIFLFNEYIKPNLSKVLKRHNIDMPKIDNKTKKKKKIKKADMIRIQNTDKRIQQIKDTIFEFVTINLLDAYLSKDGDDKNKYFYTLIRLLKYNISNFNNILKDILNKIIKNDREKFNKKKFVKNAYKYIERNNEIQKYKDIELYAHQKELFSKCKEKQAKLILYQAPTGTGKTMSPIGLVKGGHRVIFVCAAKHVGLQLAKACISMEIKVGVAFGCKDAGNIRLHYFAAKETIRNRRTGGIFRVDNEVGDNVEIMISDVQSYLPAMNYMRAFNNLNDIILYWDEPTITLDYKEHKYHSVLSENWVKNEIPNIVLSSATLPKENDLREMLSGFQAKFESTNIVSIVSHDCSKTIPILDTEGNIVLPHLVYNDFKELRKCVKHLKNYKTLLRHFDLREVCKFILYVNKKCDLADIYKIDNYFDSIDDIDVISIKNYYLKLLLQIKNEYDGVFEHFAKKRNPYFNKPIKITTSDAHTLTDGPTIYLADNIEKIGQFCLKIANIPTIMLDAILEDMGYNEGIRQQMEKINYEINKNIDSSKDDDRKKSKGYNNKSRNETKKSGPNENDIKTKELMERCEGLRSQIRRIRLGSKFIPNSSDHLEAWNHNDVKNAFTSSIDDEIVEKIMLLKVEAHWKVLLMMGIGVFAKHANIDYVAIMKELAVQQKLYLIIASSDYIYGTNYQFCHGYIGKDLASLSQEKLIQAFGRVGRTSARQDYSIRLRSNDMIQTLFQKSENSIEVENMNKLFTYET
jgi:hypothetical protein